MIHLYNFKYRIVIIILISVLTMKICRSELIDGNDFLSLFIHKENENVHGDDNNSNNNSNLNYSNNKNKNLQHQQQQQQQQQHQHQQQQQQLLHYNHQQSQRTTTSSEHLSQNPFVSDEKRKDHMNVTSTYDVLPHIPPLPKHLSYIPAPDDDNKRSSDYQSNNNMPNRNQFTFNDGHEPVHRVTQKPTTINDTTLMSFTTTDLITTFDSIRDSLATQHQHQQQQQQNITADTIQKRQDKLLPLTLQTIIYHNMNNNPQAQSISYSSIGHNIGTDESSSLPSLQSSPTSSDFERLLKIKQNINESLYNPIKIFSSSSSSSSSGGKVDSSVPQIYSRPSEIYSEPSKVYSEPSKIYSEPSKIYSKPSLNYGEPSKTYWPTRFTTTSTIPTGSIAGTRHRTSVSTTATSITTNSNVHHRVIFNLDKLPYDLLNAPKEPQNPTDPQLNHQINDGLMSLSVSPTLPTPHLTVSGRQLQPTLGQHNYHHHHQQHQSSVNERQQQHQELLTGQPHHYHHQFGHHANVSFKINYPTQFLGSVAATTSNYQNLVTKKPNNDPSSYSSSPSNFPSMILNFELNPKKNDSIRTNEQTTIINGEQKSFDKNNSQNVTSQNNTTTSERNKNGKKVGGGSGGDDDDSKIGYIIEDTNYRKYRIEEKISDSDFIVGEYGILSHNDGSLRGVRYTADSKINSTLIYDALMKFLSL